MHILVGSASSRISNKIILQDDEKGKSSDYTQEKLINSHLETLGWDDFFAPDFEFLIKPEFGSLLKVGDEVNLDCMEVNSPVHIVLVENLPVDNSKMFGMDRGTKLVEFWKSFPFDNIVFTITKRLIRFEEKCIIELYGKFNP